MFRRLLLLIPLVLSAAFAQTEAPDSKTEPKPAEPAPPDSPSAQSHFVIVEGDKGVGSGCIMMMDNQPRLVTNAHVLSGNAKLTFKLLNGQEVKCTNFEVSATEDLARGTPAGATGGLAILAEAEKTAKIGDEIVVYGNSDGGGVVREITGYIKGIGPTEIEVDAEFVSGNSGSPVIHKPTGKVIAVATYVIIPNVTAVNQTTELTKPRRFCIRVDQAKKWEGPSWAKFSAESKKLDEFHASTIALSIAGVTSHRVLDSGGRPGYGGRNPFQVQDLQQAINGLSANKHIKTVRVQFASLAQKDWSRISDADRSSEVAHYMKRLSTSLFEDMRAFRPEHFTAYHRKVFERELEYRKTLQKRFDDVIHSVSPSLLTRP